MTNKFISNTMASVICLAAAGFLAGPQVQAQSAAAVPVAGTNTVTLTGNVRREATAANDRGPVSGSLRMNHMLLQLKRTPAQEAALEARIQAMHQPGSPDFHKWLTPEQLGRQYGPATADIEAVTSWLESHGLTINSVAKSGMVIDFSGSAEQVQSTFNTPMHTLSVNGATHIANMQNPQIPAVLANLVVGVSSLNDFRPHPAITGVSRAHIDPLSKAVEPAGKPGFTVSSAYQLVVPDDVHTIYNFNPVYKKNITGTKQTVVVLEDTNLYTTADWYTFRSTFGLSKYTKASLSQIHPGGCTNPGVNSNDGEAAIDVEYASAAAPNAAIVLASCADTETTFGGLLALQSLINEDVPPHVISISYIDCEAGLGAAGNATYNYAYEQAASEGVSVFVASGDEGAASCDYGEASAELGIAVNGFASTPYDVAVGGTDFGDAYAGTTAQYWNAKNNSIYGSAKSYIPEIPWNDSCASTLITNIEGYNVPYGKNGFCNSTLGEEYFISTVADSGGPSNCAYGETNPNAGTPAYSGTCSGYAKPNYQSGTYGNPSDGVRDLPDVSLFAANGVWGHYYIVCYSDPKYGVPCTGNPANWAGYGGTSVSAPIVAGIQALVNQSQGAPQGNPNYVYYALAKQEFGGTGKNSCVSTLGKDVESSCIFYDVAQGDNDVSCLGKFNCYTPSGLNGVLSVTSKAYSKAYNSTTGWDFASGIGTLNVGNLVNDWDDAF